MDEQLLIVGSGTIACGLAAAAAHHGPVRLLARSEASAQRAQAQVEKTLAKMEAQVDPDHVQIVTELTDIGRPTFAVEAVIEHHQTKAGILAELSARLDERAILATTTSSLSITKLAEASGRPNRFCGLHVFNPVTRMKLVELVFPPQAEEETKRRARALCEVLEKTPVEVPDIPGFVVNRLLFPYLFSAVRLMEETGMAAEDIDTCMRLGAGHPMGPLALLDLVGLDVSKAIGEEIGAPIPPKVEELIGKGHLGRKTGRGFLTYDKVLNW